MGVPTIGIHGDMPASGVERALAEDSMYRVLICPAALARGLDLPRVRHVVMYDVCDDAATFVHCAGRTARRGRKGLVTCLIPSGGGRFRELHSLQGAEPLEFQEVTRKN